MSKRSEAGQATTEYLIVAIGVVIALVILTVAGRESCLEGMALDPSSKACQSLDKAFSNVLQHSIEDVTFLLNLPF